MTTDDAIKRLAKALRDAAEEHGRPNTFACAELETHHRGPPAMMAGRIGNSPELRHRLWQALGGSAGWGSCPAYSGRRFAV